MDPAAFAHATLIHVRHNFVNGFAHGLYAALPVTGDRVGALHDRVLAPVFAFAFCRRLDRFDLPD